MANPKRPITIKQAVQEADPTWNEESRRPIEYEFSNGRKFRGVAANRGAYADEE